MTKGSDSPGHTDLMVAPETLDQYMADNPLPCCMWCGGEMPESGWHFYRYPEALCSEKCSTAFKAAF